MIPKLLFYSTLGFCEEIRWLQEFHYTCQSQSNFILKS